MDILAFAQGGITNADAQVVLYQVNQGGPMDCLSYYYFHELVREGKITPVSQAPKAIRL